jgi:hypothetical protein
MKYCFSLLFALFFLNSNCFAQYPNFVLFPSSNVQIEPIITKHPTNPQILFASAYTSIGGLPSEGIYVTTNGGLNWHGTDQNPGAPTQNHSGDPGPIIDKNGVFIITHLGTTPPGMFSNFSTDTGTTWSNSILVAGNNQEKGSPGTDVDPSSPYYGRTYVAWSLPSIPYRIILSYTNNSASSWSSVINVNNSQANHQSLGAIVAFGAGGKVYVCWASANLSGQLNEDCIGFAYSTNGGVNWSPQECAYSVNGIRTAQFPPWNVRVNGYPSLDIDNTGGARNGWIYIVSAEVNHAPAGSDADIVFHRSTDGGITWSSPGIRVNQDALNNGRVQFFPVIAVDNNGGLNVVYYDNRNNPDSVEVYLSHSTNGGDNWSDYKISDHHFMPRTAAGFGPGIIGDHIGITHVNNKLYPVWMDDYNSSPGVFKIWSAIIDANTIGIQKIGTEVPSLFSLDQNYPNPFNPSTKIRFDVASNRTLSEAKGLNVQLIIYNVLGKEVASLIDEQLKPGTYETEWNASKYASGVYYYKLIVTGADLSNSSGFTRTRKMVLLK